MKRRWVLVLAVAACTRAPSRGEQLRALADTLVKRGAEDQNGRDRIASAVANNDTVYLKKLASEDSARSLWLRAVISKYGWPGKALVGDSAAHYAWLMLQHTPFDDFQAAMLPVLDTAAQRGDVPKSDLALLIDRVRVHQGKPQLYGGSFSVKDKRLVPDPIDDVAHVDERRATMGLPPMADYVKMLGEVYKMPVTWPPK
jgi:hypothetical protein